MGFLDYLLMKLQNKCIYIFFQHFKLHNFSMYQCVFCMFGSEVIDAMLCHLAMEHFEYDCICVERSLAVPNSV